MCFSTLSAYYKYRHIGWYEVVYYCLYLLYLYLLMHIICFRELISKRNDFRSHNDHTTVLVSAELVSEITALV